MQPSLFERSKGLTGFQLKIIALALMTLDHIHYFLSGLLPVPGWFTVAGRAAAPIFVFMVASGFEHTRSRPRYLLRLYLFAAGMGLLNLLENAYLPHPAGAMAIGNIFATMFYIVYFLLCIETARSGKREGDRRRMLLGVLGAALPLVLQVPLFALLLSGGAGQAYLPVLLTTALPLPIMVEGGPVFILLGVGLYYTRRSRKALSIFYLAVCALFLAAALPGGFTAENLLGAGCQWMMWLALPLLLLYNGERGRGMKYLFYFYYPLHMLALLLVARAVG